MIANEIVEIVRHNPITAAINGQEDVPAVVNSPCEVVFLLSATIKTMKGIVEEIHQAGKLVFIHVDLMKGLACDVDGLAFLKEEVKPDGIISTKGFVVKKAKELGFVTVQRMFVLDSKSIDMGIKQMKDMKPDFVEVMPGPMTKAIRRVTSRVSTPIIAGGLIDEEQEVMDLLKSGAVSVSTSAKALWEI